MAIIEVLINHTVFLYNEKYKLSEKGTALPIYDYPTEQQIENYMQVNEIRPIIQKILSREFSNSKKYNQNFGNWYELTA